MKALDFNEQGVLYGRPVCADTSDLDFIDRHFALRAKKIPDLAKGIGEGIKEFKKAAKDVEKEGEAPKIADKKPDSEKKEG